MEEEDREAVGRRSRCVRLRELEEYNSSFRAVRPAVPLRVRVKCCY